MRSLVSHGCFTNTHTGGGGGLDCKGQAHMASFALQAEPQTVYCRFEACT